MDNHKLHDILYSNCWPVSSNNNYLRCFTYFFASTLMNCSVLTAYSTDICIYAMLNKECGRRHLLIHCGKSIGA